MKFDVLIGIALEAREKAYCPYSHYSVGAAVLCSDGSIYYGCNIENSVNSPSICAERTAIYKAISEGQREFQAIAIIGGQEGEPPTDHCSPCGVCRQVMAEFCKDDFIIIAAKSKEEYKEYRLVDLLPHMFVLGKN